MSRLERNQQKQFLTTVFFCIIILVIIIYFIFSFGLRLLLDASVFISNLGSKNNVNTALNKTNDFVGSIEIDDILTATNSAQIVVSGTVANFDTVEFYLNGDKVNQIKVPVSESFSEEIGDLNKGENEIYAVAKSKKNNQSKKSKKYIVFYKSEKPKLEIKEPADSSTTNKNEIVISGVTDKETFVKINDLPQVVDVLGNFQANIRLKDGENKITIVAQDIAGNVETKTLTVTYRKDD
jgi:hypothetical protein